MHRPPRDHIPHAPNDFAKVLIEKLKVLENKQIQEDKLNARLRKVEVSLFRGQMWFWKLRNIIKDPFLYPEVI